MAATGTATAVFNNNGGWVVTIGAVTQGSTSQTFSMKNYFNSSFVITGTFGGATCQWQGTNDGTNWVNVGPPMASTDSLTGSVTPGDIFYDLYRLNVTGGGGTTSISATVLGIIPR